MSEMHVHAAECAGGIRSLGCGQNHRDLIAGAVNGRLRCGNFHQEASVVCRNAHVCGKGTHGIEHKGSLLSFCGETCTELGRFAALGRLYSGLLRLCEVEAHGNLVLVARP